MVENLKKKKILVLGRRDHTEAMRVAAGLTVAGHEIRLVFMTKPVEETAEAKEEEEVKAAENEKDDEEHEVYIHV